MKSTNCEVIPSGLSITTTASVKDDGSVIKHVINGTTLTVEEHIEWAPYSTEDVESRFYLTDRTLCISLEEGEIDVVTGGRNGYMLVRVTSMMASGIFIIKLTRLGGTVVSEEKVLLIEED